MKTLIKTTKEQTAIRGACQITDEIFSLLTKLALKNMTEQELAHWILSEIKKHKVTPSFPPIVTSGVRAGNEIHPQPTGARLEGFVIIDFGVIYRGYCSDMTRTVFVGRPIQKDRDMYALVLHAQDVGMRAALPDQKCAAADQASRAALGEYARYFIHTLGHGIGRHVHELPHIYHKRTHNYFRVGMAVTIEPGIYIPNRLGIRIEDTYFVTPSGLEQVTQSQKKLLIF